MLISLTTLFATLSAIFNSRAALQLENLALRHQIGVLQRSARKRPKLTSVDRLLWVWLSRIWGDWRPALAIVEPETVVAWHRAGFRLYWTWKVRRGQPGRPIILREVRDLIRKMCRENPCWGAPRIHGELLKLGINIGESSVSKYMVRSRKPPSQTWRTFLENHAQQLVSIDFFTVPTIRFQVANGVRCRAEPSADIAANRTRIGTTKPTRAGHNGGGASDAARAFEKLQVGGEAQARLLA
jgi:putative transposase